MTSCLLPWIIKLFQKLLLKVRICSCYPFTVHVSTVVIHAVIKPSLRLAYDNELLKNIAVKLFPGTEDPSYNDTVCYQRFYC